MEKTASQAAKSKKFKYSKQALVYLLLIEDFDVEEFEKHYIKNILVGGGDIMSFVAKKKKITKEKLTSLKHL